jgi:hypothetical protein
MKVQAVRFLKCLYNSKQHGNQVLLENPHDLLSALCKAKGHKILHGILYLR